MHLGDPGRGQAGEQILQIIKGVEAVPPDRWADNFRAILDEVNRHTV